MKPVFVVPTAFALCAEQQQLGQAAVAAGPEVPGRSLAQGRGRHVWRLGWVHPLSPLPGGCVAPLTAAPCSSWGAALSCTEPTHGLHPLPTPGGSWQCLPPGLLTAGKNGSETPGAGGPFVSPRCLWGRPFQLGSRRRAELSAGLPHTVGNGNDKGKGVGVSQAGHSLLGAKQRATASGSVSGSAWALLTPAAAPCALLHLFLYPEHWWRQSRRALT